MLKLFKKQKEEVSFIFGCPRGGTTWLWSLLESHQDIVPFTNGIEKDAEGYYATSESGIYIKQPKKAKKTIVSFCKNNKGKIIIEKTPLHTLKYNLIKKDFPNSKDIVILRNPVAIVNSMYTSNMVAFENYDIDKSIEEVKKYFSVLSGVINAKTAHVISYENLLKDTKTEFTKVLNYLNVSAENIDAIISDNKNKTKVSVSGAYRKGQSDSFKNDLSKEEILLITEGLKVEIALFNQHL
ncbi:sulfotransferase family protein [Winogradskyella arenosi]|uniref:Sulfotransferase family protein n=1 Tax=Winogradskyella arenosi TaxID=533325 RepID=A0A368ZE33_9FLAO|nr:sulfotransferase [Winogradskyella arenosi]RCW91509.1 sulfotransferase family protein [Winogradskyella arenosi]